MPSQSVLAENCSSIAFRLVTLDTLIKLPVPLTSHLITGTMVVPASWDSREDLLLWGL